MPPNEDEAEEDVWFEEEPRLAFIAVSNVLLGVGAFLTLKLPEPWALRAAPEPPECDCLGDGSRLWNFRWVIKGRARAILVNEERGKAFVFCVEIRPTSSKSAEEALAKLVDKLLRARGASLIDRGRVEVAGHNAELLLMEHTHKRPLRRDAVKEYRLHIAFPCRETGRLVVLSVMGGTSLRETLADVLSVVSNVLCHDDPSLLARAEPS